MNHQLGRREFLMLAGAGMGAAAFGITSERVSGENLNAPAPEQAHGAIVRIQMDSACAAINFLSWDTEGGSRAQTNLLRANTPVVLRIRTRGKWVASDTNECRTTSLAGGGIAYAMTIAPGAELRWEILPRPGSFKMTVSSHGQNPSQVEEAEIIFPFDPRVTPTTLLPQTWHEDGRGALPAVISSPDFGQMLIENLSHPDVKARLEGNRDNHVVDLSIELPNLADGATHSLDFTPVQLPSPKGLTNQSAWREIRRGWFNTWQPSSRWGDQSRAFSAPAGILSNNVISDPVSFALAFYADQALWTPQIAPGVSVIDQVRHSIDWWLENRTDPSGEVIGYWDYRHFLDANPGIIISAWDYVEATGDRDWLKRHIEQLERLSDFLEERDVDSDGMVEATQSGNFNTLLQPARSCCWWDALNCGHKDGYTNAFIYRAWRCLAELERQLGRDLREKRVTERAARLKKAYFKTLYNPETGWLAWWKSADGQLHDYASPIVNGLAIDYGLVEREEGRTILKRLRNKMREVGFTRLDLGMPCTLVPVHRADYLQPDGLGLPQREDGTDTFQFYMNGGISAGHSLHFIMAHYRVGETRLGDEILQAMLGRQAKIGFHNGVQNEGNKGIDWTTWSGAPAGYEGYLADVFMFLQAAVLREPSCRARFYRPLEG